MKQFGKGAIPDKKDNRDYIYEALGTQSLSDKEWELGYDIEKEVGKIPIKNQFSSSSCIGQAFAYYWGVLTGKEISAKAIYSLVTLGYGQGAYLRDGAKLITDKGSLLESVLSSYLNGATTETFMIDKSWLNPETEKLMAELKAYEYFNISNYTMDGFARAIKDGKGMVAGVRGTNNGTWSSVYPKPPTSNTPNAEIWGHALYFGKFRIKNGEKELGFLNSWGDIGEKGWQWIGKEWFNTYISYIFSPWLLIKKSMTNETAKVLKDKNSSAVGIWLPAISEAVLKSYLLNIGKDLPMKNEEIDWEKLIDGEFEYK